MQADPIRSPARAQDLILRHRVKDYKAGDLEKRYSSLDIEEDVLYAYGFLPYANWKLMHPRSTAGLTATERRILAITCEHGELHPKDLEPHLGKERTINAWGGYSKSTTRMLEDLHYRGILRVAARRDGIKIYAIAPELEQHLSPEQRLRELALLITRILAPVPITTLRSVLNHLRYCAPTLLERRSVLKDLLSAGLLESVHVEGVEYVYPASLKYQGEVGEVVRFLAPFDPIVWDRRRFEHFWDWAYRFEAYTPAPKRKYGYYALPLLWVDRIVGWANVSTTGEKMSVTTGFLEPKTKRDSLFKQALADEIDRFRHFLDC